MRRCVLVLLLLLCATGAYANDQFSYSGYFQTEVSLRINHGNGDLTKFKNIFQLAGQYKIMGDELVFFSKVRYWYDAAYGLRDKMDSAQHYQGHVQRTDWLRDCYLDYSKNPWFFRLGKQQVVWGQSDGIAVLDRINPVDLSEYWLPDMEYLRIPLWMANINYSPKLDSNLQILIIPDFEQSTSAAIGAPFTVYSYTRYNNWKNTVGGVDENIYFPAKKFENSTFGVQWSDRFADMNYTFNYLTGYYYSARNFSSCQTPPIYGGPYSFWKVNRLFKRYSLYGGSFNKSITNPGPLQGFTFRGDFAYYNNEPMYYGNPSTASSVGIKRWNNIMWVLGADRYVFTKWLISGQYGQYILEHSKPNAPRSQNNYILNPYTYGAMDPVENIFSLKISTNFMNDRVKPEVLWSFTDDNQGRISPKVTYEIKDNLWLTLGVHYFYGHMVDSNGQYRDQDQAYMNLKFTF